MSRKILEVEQKALEINLDDKVYGSFSEIGAGQEVARYFFKVGAAAGTIAKTMSAYDKTYSDAIYGEEPSGRYVCESRVYRMLDHEYELIEDRLRGERPDNSFFVFADTVAAINYSRTIKGHGWLGLRFQLTPDGGHNDIVLHVKMEDQSTNLQQQAIGILGVNLVYACYRHHDDPKTLVASLMDNLHGRVKIDMVRLSGANFEDLDNRLLSLWLVEHQMCDVALFNGKGENVHASEFLYKKNVLVVRGSYRPTTLVNMDMINKSYRQFKQDPEVDSRKVYRILEMTLDNLRGGGDELDEKDFLDRVAVLNALGETVAITNCGEHQKLIQYLADYKVQKLGLVTGVRTLLEVINQRYYNNEDRILQAFGEIFTKKVKMYVYPAMQEGREEFMTAKNLPIPDGLTFLYQYLIDSKNIIDIEDANPDILHIYSRDVLDMIKSGKDDAWEKMVYPKVAELIKEQCLFDYPFEQMEFDY